MSGRGGNVLLTTLSVRTSAKGNAYLAGWLGKASVVGFAGEPDKYGNPTWDLYVTTPQERGEGERGSRQQQPRLDGTATYSRAPGDA